MRRRLNASSRGTGQRSSAISLASCVRPRPRTTLSRRSFCASGRARNSGTKRARRALGSFALPLINHLRSVRGRPQQPLEMPANPLLAQEESTVPAWMIDAAALQPEAAAERAEQMEQLHSLVHELPADKRAVFGLVYEADLDLRGAAAELGIPEGTVKSRLYYAKKKLAQEWQEWDE